MPLEVIRVFAPPLAVALALLMGLFANTYAQYVLFLALIAGTTGAALVLLVGLGRVIMLATGAMMAIGAYSSTFLVQDLSVSYIPAVFCGGVLGTLAGIALAVPAMRFRGHNLAMVTLIFQAIAIIAIRELPHLGGAEGMRVKPPEILGQVLAEDYQYLLLAGVFASSLIFLIAVLQHGRFGKILKAIADTEIGIEAYGVHINGYRIATFAITSGCLAVLGALLAPRIRIIDPETFGLLASVNALAYPIVGGMGSVWGGLIGGSVLSALPELLRPMAEFKAFIFAALVLVVMTVLPGGLMQLAARLRVRPSPVTSTEEAGSIRAPVLAQKSALPGAVSGANALTPALEIIRVGKRFGNLHAVSGVSLTVEAGTIHGLIGPNGAGKTTLFNMVSAFMTPDAGEIRYFGKSNRKVLARSLLSYGIARTFQHVAVYGTLTCLDNVILGLGHNALGRSLLTSFREPFNAETVARERRTAADALARVGLANKMHMPANVLSLGDQRRLEIARAIVSRPRLILLDEPMSGVSLEEEHQLLTLLRDLNAELGLTMFLIEHNIRFVLEICNRLSVMSAGSIIAEGAPEEVIARPEVRRTYFGTEEVAAA